MLASNQSTVGFEAAMAVTVPRNAAGTLEDGVVNVIESVDCVTVVEEVDITGLTPRLNDMAVEATVTLSTNCATIDDATVALEDGFGVQSVTVSRAVQATREPQPQKIEFG